MKIIMENLVLNDNGKVITNSLLVAERFEKQTQHVNEAIKKLITSIENPTDLFTESRYEDSYGRVQFCYAMNRDGFSLLVMGFTGKKALQFKLEFIAAFNAMEAALRPAVPQTYAEALMEAAKMALKVEEQQKTLACQQEQLRLQAPRVLFSQAVETSQRSILIGELAKYIRQNGVEIGQNRLFEILRKRGYLCERGESYNLPTQRAMEAGLFDIKKTTINKPDGTILVSTTTKVTGKGQVYFINKFLKNKQSITQ